MYTLTTFDFIITFLIVYQLLSHLAGNTIKLQSRTLDVVAAYKQIESYFTLQSYKDKLFEPLHLKTPVTARIKRLRK